MAALVAPGHFDVRTLKSTAFAFMVAGLLLAALAPTSGLLMQVCVGAGAASCRLFAYSLACMRARQARVSAIPASGAVKALIIVATSGGLQVGASALPLGQTGTLVLFVLGACLMSVFLSPFNIGEESVIEEARRSGRTASQAAKLEALGREVLFVLGACLMSVFLSPFNIGEESVIEEARRSGRTASQAAKLEALGRELGLSQRETTVFQLMARGLNASEISEGLFITKRRTASQAAKLEALGRELGLSQRETTVFQLMARGLNASEISEGLFITKSAVRAHQSRIYAKLGVHSQREFADAVEGCLG